MCAALHSLHHTELVTCRQPQITFRAGHAANAGSSAPVVTRDHAARRPSSAGCFVPKKNATVTSPADSKGRMSTTHINTPHTARVHTHAHAHACMALGCPKSMRGTALQGRGSYSAPSVSLSYSVRQICYTNTGSHPLCRYLLSFGGHVMTDL